MSLCLRPGCTGPKAWENRSLIWVRATVNSQALMPIAPTGVPGLECVVRCDIWGRVSSSTSNYKYPYAIC